MIWYGVFAEVNYNIDDVSINLIKEYVGIPYIYGALVPYVNLNICISKSW